MTGYIEPKSKYSNFLGKRVMELCREKDMTIEEIANEIGMSRSSFYQYLSGKFEPKAATVYTFAKYFGVSADYLMGITSTREDNADLRKIGDCLKLSDKALETFLDLTDESCVYSASTCLEEATAAYWPAIPDPGNEDVEGKKYLTRFSKIYDISNNELFNELLSQEEWLQVPRFLNNFFILFNFERQLCVLLDCLTGWLRDHEDGDLELKGRVLEETNKCKQCLKEVRERKEYIFFKLQRILTQATENCAKQFSDKQAALNKKNADTILRELLGQEE